MNNDQLKHMASALNAIAFAEFAAFGYAVIQAGGGGLGGILSKGSGGKN